MKVPEFRLYGQDDPTVENEILPVLEFRNWSDLSDTEVKTAYQQLVNSGWVTEHSAEILQTIYYLNHKFLRICPGKNLHKVVPQRDHQGHGNDFDRRKAAAKDFYQILCDGGSDPVVYRMLSKLAAAYIDDYSYRRAKEATTTEDRDKALTEAFGDFDRLANCFNHIFEQFGVNQHVTRSGFVPRQDKRIIDDVYTPTIEILSDPKWKSVNQDLSEMFEDYQNENYPEAITKAHRGVQRFLQILVGEEGKNAKGEVGKLFQQAKRENLLLDNRFSSSFVSSIQNTIVSERATNSTAKPSLKDATSSDALLVMNLVMVFLQHCLQQK